MAADLALADHCEWQPPTRSDLACAIMTTMMARPELCWDTFMPAVQLIDAGSPVPSDSMPNLAHARWCYSLPNVTSELIECCFSHQTAGSRNTDPVVHVLSKAWPMRCSIRNFNEIVRNYIQADSNVYRLLLGMLHCTLAGKYCHSTVVPRFKTRRRLYRYFVSECPTPREFSDWVTPSHQQLLFIAIKEYMVFAVANVPGLQSVLRDSYPWDDFVSAVTVQADYVRKTVDDNSHMNRHLFDDATAGVNPLRSFKHKPSRVQTVHLYSDMLAAIRSTCCSTASVFTCPLRCNLQALASAVGNDLPSALEKLLFATPVVAAVRMASSNKMTMATRASFNVMLESLLFREVYLIHETACACVFNMSVTATSLPACVHKRQQATLSKQPHRRNTSVFVCMCCRQLRAFVVDDCTASKNRWACGSNKVLLDDATGVLYCGKKIEKGGASSRNQARSNDQNRNYWKQQQNFMCRHSRLVEIPLLGTLLECFGSLYMLCPSCLCVMLLRPQRFDGGPVCCIHCQYQQGGTEAPRCFHCYCEGTHMAELYDDCVACADCYKPWMRDTSLVRQAPMEMLHRAVNERWRRGRLQLEIDEHASSRRLDHSAVPGQA